MEICLSDLKKELVNWISNHNQVLLSDIIITMTMANLTSVIEELYLINKYQNLIKMFNIKTSNNPLISFISITSALLAIIQMTLWP